MSGGYLTTHVLDTARGAPAAGLTLELYRIDGEDRTLVTTAVTNEDGRTDRPLLPQGQFAVGVYELVFRAGAYLDRVHGAAAGPRFLERIPVRFGIADPAAHYHVPLLLAPCGYTTYRGS